MFLRKLTVILVPLGLLLLLCLLAGPLNGLGNFWSSLVLGALLGTALSLLLPLAGATKQREPFAHLLWIPAALVLAVLVYQYFASLGVDVPLLRLFFTLDLRVITLESAFAAFMISFSVRTGKGI